MAKQTINIGTSANDGTGSTLRAAFDICNDNFTELYDGTGGLLHKIEGTNFLEPKPAIISNVTAKEENNLNRIKPLLIDQITSRVRWKESVDFMIKKGVNEFLEIGPGKVLSGLVKKINNDIKKSNINSIKDIQDDKF